MTKWYRDCVSIQVEKYADAWAKRHVGAAFTGDVSAALALSVALDNGKRGAVARAMWEAKVPREAYGAYLASVWSHDHGLVIEAAQSRPRLVHMFRYARFELPATLSPLVQVWRGTRHCDLQEAMQGYSWTTDRDVACWFAMRFGDGVKRPLVLTAQVDRADILLFDDARSEREVVLARPPKFVSIDGEVTGWRRGHQRSSDLWDANRMRVVTKPRPGAPTPKSLQPWSKAGIATVTAPNSAMVGTSALTS